MSEQALNTFNEQGVFVITSTHGWQGRDRLKAVDLGKEEDEIPDIFRLGNKDLLDQETRVKLQRPASKVRSLMDRFGKPFIIGRAIDFVPNKNIVLVRDGLQAIDREMAETVECFLRGLPPFIQHENGFDVSRPYDPHYKGWRIEQYPVLANAKWPTPDQIRKRFRLSYMALQIQTAEVQSVDMEDVIQAKLEMQMNARKSFQEYGEYILKDAQGAIIEVCNEVAEKIRKGQKITATMLKKPRRVLEDYLNVAQLFDLDDVKREILRVQNLVESTDTDELRGDFNAGIAFAEALKAMGDSIGDLSGLSADGHVKRVVKKAA